MHRVYRQIAFVFLTACSYCVFAADLELSSAPADAAVTLIAPQDGQTVSSPLVVKFGISGMSLSPAGTAHPGTGHHHLLLDHDGVVNLNGPLPANAQVIHFGKAQTETTLELSPGKHTLQLLLGDYLHVPHNPPVVSKRITILVE